MTIGAAYTPIGPFKIVANMTIVLAKAALIFWFYMHLREERGLARLAVIGAAVWLAILSCYSRAIT